MKYRPLFPPPPPSLVSEVPPFLGEGGGGKFRERGVEGPFLSSGGASKDGKFLLSVKTLDPSFFLFRFWRPWEFPATPRPWSLFPFPPSPTA